MGLFFRSPFAAAGTVTALPVPADLSGAHDVEFEVDFPDDARAARFCAFLKSALPEVRASRPAAARPEDPRVVNCAVLIVPDCGTIDDYEAVLDANAERLNGRVEGWAIRK